MSVDPFILPADLPDDDLAARAAGLRVPLALLLQASTTFSARVDRTAPEGCWRWTGASGGNGYGLTTLDRRLNRGAHRVAYSLAVGPIPPATTRSAMAATIRPAAGPPTSSPGPRPRTRAMRCARGATGAVGSLMTTTS